MKKILDNQSFVTKQDLFDTETRLRQEIEDLAGMVVKHMASKEDIQGINEGMKGMKVEIHGMKEDIQGINGEMQGMKVEIHGMKEDIQGINGEMQGMKVEIHGMKEDIQEMKGEIKEIKGALNQIIDGNDRIIVELLALRTEQSAIHGNYQRLEKRVERLEEYQHI